MVPNHDTAVPGHPELHFRLVGQLEPLGIGEFAVFNRGGERDVLDRLFAPAAQPGDHFHLRDVAVERHA